MSGARHADDERGGDKRVQAVFTISNKRGLHARASSKFVQLAEPISDARNWILPRPKCRA
jgi:hypothetical protein